MANTPASYHDQASEEDEEEDEEEDDSELDIESESEEEEEPEGKGRFVKTTATVDHVKYQEDLTGVDGETT